MGFMLWIFYLAIPAYYLDVYDPGAPLSTALILVSPILLLVLGIYLKRREILLCLYPVSLLLPLVLWRELASTQLYSAGNFAVTCALTLAYLATVLVNLRRPSSARRIDALPPQHARAGARWSAVVSLIYAAIGVGSFVAAVALINFHGGFAQALKISFRTNADAARIQLNLYGFFVWLTLFFYYLVNSFQSRFTGEQEPLKSETGETIRSLRPSQRALLLHSVLALILLFAFAWVFYYHR